MTDKRTTNKKLAEQIENLQDNHIATLQKDVAWLKSSVSWIRGVLWILIPLTIAILGMLSIIMVLL